VAQAESRRRRAISLMLSLAGRRPHGHDAPGRPPGTSPADRLRSESPRTEVSTGSYRDASHFRILTGVLSVRGLEVSYGGGIRAVRGVSVDVPDRGVVAVLGSNGAGKSTLLRAVSGSLRGIGGGVDAGTVEVAG